MGMCWETPFPFNLQCWIARAHFQNVIQRTSCLVLLHNHTRTRRQNTALSSVELSQTQPMLSEIPANEYCQWIPESALLVSFIIGDDDFLQGTNWFASPTPSCLEVWWHTSRMFSTWRPTWIRWFWFGGLSSPRHTHSTRSDPTLWWDSCCTFP